VKLSDGPELELHVCDNRIAIVKVFHAGGEGSGGWFLLCRLLHSTSVC
jgi:hypothetical protein